MAARVSTVWFLRGGNVPTTTDIHNVLGHYPQSVENAALDIARRLYPDREFERLGSHPLSVAATVQPGYVFIASFGEMTVACSADLTGTLPSELPASWRALGDDGSTFLVNSIPETAQGSFALWSNGSLQRSFSAVPVDITENLGIPSTWELEFWAGEHPLRYPPGILPDPQSLPFHPQQFAEAANLHWLGFRYTGEPREGELDPSRILLWGFKIHRIGEGPRVTPPAQPAQPTQTPEGLRTLAPSDDGTSVKPRGRIARLFGSR